MLNDEKKQTLRQEMDAMLQRIKTVENVDVTRMNAILNPEYGELVEDATRTNTAKGWYVLFDFVNKLTFNVFDDGVMSARYALRKAIENYNNAIAKGNTDAEEHFKEIATKCVDKLKTATVAEWYRSKTYLAVAALASIAFGILAGIGTNLLPGSTATMLGALGVSATLPPVAIAFAGALMLGGLLLLYPTIRRYGLGKYIAAIVVGIMAGLAATSGALSVTLGAGSLPAVGLGFAAFGLALTLIIGAQFLWFYLKKYMLGENTPAPTRFGTAQGWFARVGNFLSKHPALVTALVFAFVGLIIMFSTVGSFVFEATMMGFGTLFTDTLIFSTVVLESALTALVSPLGAIELGSIGAGAAASTNGLTVLLGVPKMILDLSIMAGPVGGLVIIASGMVLFGLYKGIQTAVNRWAPASMRESPGLKGLAAAVLFVGVILSAGAFMLIPGISFLAVGLSMLGLTVVLAGVLRVTAVWANDAEKLEAVTAKELFVATATVATDAQANIVRSIQSCRDPANTVAGCKAKSDLEVNVLVGANSPLTNHFINAYNMWKGGTAMAKDQIAARAYLISLFQVSDPTKPLTDANSRLFNWGQIRPALNMTTDQLMALKNELYTVDAHGAVTPTEPRESTRSMLASLNNRVDVSREHVEEKASTLGAALWQEWVINEPEIKLRAREELANMVATGQYTVQSLVDRIDEAKQNFQAKYPGVLTDPESQAIIDAIPGDDEDYTATQALVDDAMAEATGGGRKNLAKLYATVQEMLADPPNQGSENYPRYQALAQYILAQQPTVVQDLYLAQIYEEMHVVAQQYAASKGQVADGGGADQNVVNDAKVMDKFLDKILQEVQGGGKAVGSNADKLVGKLMYDGVPLAKLQARALVKWPNPVTATQPQKNVVELLSDKARHLKAQGVNATTNNSWMEQAINQGDAAEFRPVTH